MKTNKAAAILMAVIIVATVMAMCVPTGVYNCTIYVEPSAVNVTAGEGAVVGIFPAVGLRTSIEITGEQILAGDVYKILVKDNEIGKPIRFIIGFSNTGNVIAEPEIGIEISKDDKVIETLKKTEEVIPGEAKEIMAEWTGKEVGGYAAKVSVLLDGKLLSERDLEFKVLERGALTCKGEIVEVKAPEEVGVGKPAKIEVYFKNTGEIAIDAKAKGEVKLNNELVEIIESDPVLIDIGKTATLTAYFSPEKPGDYLIDGDVIYDGKKAKMSQISLSVKSAEEEAGGVRIPEFWTLIAVISGLALVAVIIAIFFVYKKKKHKK